MRSTIGAMLIASGLALPALAQEPAQSLIGLTPPGATYAAGSVAAMTPDGKTVIGSTLGTGLPYIWSAESGLIVLSYQPGIILHGLSRDASVVVGRVGFSAVRWTASGGVVVLGGLPGASQSDAYGVSPDGRTVVGFSWMGSAGFQAFTWTAEFGVRPLQAPGWSLELALAFTANGAIVGGGREGRTSTQQPYRLDGGGVQGFGYPPGASAATPGPCGFSSDGQNVAGQAQLQLPNQLLPFAIGQDRVPRIIPSLPGLPGTGVAAGASDGGMVVGYFYGGPPAGYIWSLPLGTVGVREYLLARAVPGVGPSTLGAVAAISADGKVLAGTGSVPGYSGQVFVARTCYANCDDSPAPTLLSVADFSCFLQRFADGDSYANCDGSTVPPVLNVGDFTCFLRKFAAGCE